MYRGGSFGGMRGSSRVLLLLTSNLPPPNIQLGSLSHCNKIFHCGSFFSSAHCLLPAAYHHFQLANCIHYSVQFSEHQMEIDNCSAGHLSRCLARRICYDIGKGRMQSPKNTTAPAALYDLLCISLCLEGLYFSHITDPLSRPVSEDD